MLKWKLITALAYWVCRAVGIEEAFLEREVDASLRALKRRFGNAQCSFLERAQAKVLYPDETERDYNWDVGPSSIVLTVTHHMRLKPYYLGFAAQMQNVLLMPPMPQVLEDATWSMDWLPGEARNEVKRRVHRFFVHKLAYPYTLEGQ